MANPNLPQPITTNDMLVAAVLNAIETQTEKLEEIRGCLIDIETALENLKNSPTQPKIQLNVDALADKITERMSTKNVSTTSKSSKSNK